MGWVIGWLGVGIAELCDLSLMSLSGTVVFHSLVLISCLVKIKIILLSQPAHSYLALKYLPTVSRCLNYQRFMDFCF